MNDIEKTFKLLGMVKKCLADLAEGCVSREDEALKAELNWCVALLDLSLNWLKEESEVVPLLKEQAKEVEND